MTRRIQLMIQVKYTIIFSCTGLGFGLNQGLHYLLFNKFEYQIFKVLYIKKNTLILKHTDTWELLSVHVLCYFFQRKICSLTFMETKVIIFLCSTKICTK